jgi:hypothetical protein
MKVVEFSAEKEIVQGSLVIRTSDNGRIINKRNRPKVRVNSSELSYEGTVRGSHVKKNGMMRFIDITRTDQGNVVTRS